MDSAANSAPSQMPLTLMMPYNKPTTTPKSMGSALSAIKLNVSVEPGFIIRVGP